MTDAADPHAIDELQSLRRIAQLAVQRHLNPPSGTMERGELRARLVDELKFVRDGEAPANIDPGCICRGNWREILKDTESLLGTHFVDGHGETFRFFGLVHGKDDYQYGMVGKSGLRLLSCVGTIAGHGYTPQQSGSGLRKPLNQ